MNKWFGRERHFASDRRDRLAGFRVQIGEYKLALRKVTYVKNRARRLSNAICSLELPRPVTDVHDAWPEQMNNGELAVVMRNVGDQNWQRALELYQWLNLQNWYTPNPRLLATMLHILGRANQLEAARELFVKTEPQLSSCIQLFDLQVSSFPWWELMKGHDHVAVHGVPDANGARGAYFQNSCHLVV